MSRTPRCGRGICCRKRFEARFLVMCTRVWCVLMASPDWPQGVALLLAPTLACDRRFTFHSATTIHSFPIYTYVALALSLALYRPPPPFFPRPASQTLIYLAAEIPSRRVPLRPVASRPHPSRRSPRGPYGPPREPPVGRPLCRCFACVWFAVSYLFLRIALGVCVCVFPRHLYYGVPCRIWFRVLSTARMHVR